MKGKQRTNSRILEKQIKGLAEDQSSFDRDAERGLETSLLEVLVGGGPGLPPARRSDSLKAAYVERGTALREQSFTAEVRGARPARIHRVRTYRSLARVAAIATVVVALLVGLGFGSAYAMPGNPLYSIKRAAESIYVSVVPGDQNKVDAYSSFTNRRLNELEHVEKRGMSNWYYSLVSDAESGIEKTCDHGKRLKAEAAQKATVKAQALTLRLERMLGEALDTMTPAQKDSVESGMSRLRKQLRMRNGTQPGSTYQNGQPGNTNGQTGGPQNTTPGGSQTQPGSQQQQNQTQSGTDQKQNQQQDQQQQETQQEQDQQQQDRETQTDSPGQPGGPDQTSGDRGR